jgi:hypothetical protein
MSRKTTHKAKGGAGKALRRLMTGKAVKQELIAEYKAKLAEIKIHMMVADHLERWKYDDVFWWHTPNGEKRDPAIAAKLQKMGVRSGIHDIMAIHRGHIFSLELKRSGERMSEPQQVFMSKILSLRDSHSAYADSFDAAIWILEQWGLLRIRTMKEPPCV